MYLGIILKCETPTKTRFQPIGSQANTGQCRALYYGRAQGIRAKILGAEDEILAIEQRLSINSLDGHIKVVQQNAQLAELDCLSAFAHLAKQNHYNCPALDTSFDLDIQKGRHPVIEKQLPLGETYVANDLFLDRETQQIIMITGPNMSGKSAILRQTALIVLLAQIGSFVPAAKARIGVVDKLFTRVGASDNISMGESTWRLK